MRSYLCTYIIYACNNILNHLHVLRAYHQRLITKELSLCCEEDWDQQQILCDMHKFTSCPHWVDNYVENVLKYPVLSVGATKYVPPDCAGAVVSPSTGGWGQWSCYHLCVCVVCTQRNRLCMWVSMPMTPYTSCWLFLSPLSFLNPFITPPFALSPFPFSLLSFLNLFYIFPSFSFFLLPVKRRKCGRRRDPLQLAKQGM